MKTIFYADQYLSHLAFILASIIVIASFLYGFFLLETVMHATARAEAERSIALQTTKLAEVGAAYLAASRTITLARAEVLGFVPPTLVETVATRDSSQALTLVDHR